MESGFLRRRPTRSTSDDDSPSTGKEKKAPTEDVAQFSVRVQFHTNVSPVMILSLLTPGEVRLQSCINTMLTGP